MRCNPGQMMSATCVILHYLYLPTGEVSHRTDTDLTLISHQSHTDLTPISQQISHRSHTNLTSTSHLSQTDLAPISH